MIVRILHDGQYELDDELDEIDRELDAAVNANDASRFETALAKAIDTVRARGQRLEDSDIRPSDLVLPPADSSLEDVRDLLTSEA